MQKFFAKKSLGQNFLIQPQIVKEIVTASGAEEGEVIVEIGPGTGLLTKDLLTTGAKVIAVEKDDRLVETLKETFGEYIDSGKLELIHGDILDTNLNLSTKYKVVANIPYYITGKIIRIFLEKQNKPQSMTVLVQKEVAERIVSKDQKESLLSISVKAYGIPKYVRTVKAGNFSPIPKVDSAILNIENISDKNFKHSSETNFFEILHMGFSSKRKKLFKNLKKNNKEGSLDHAFETCGIEKGLRGEDLSIDDWICLVNKLH